jgi:hypothetical protein
MTFCLLFFDCFIAEAKSAAARFFKIKKAALVNCLKVKLG